jgi:hypothetical protein
MTASQHEHPTGSLPKQAVSHEILWVIRVGVQSLVDMLDLVVPVASSWVIGTAIS